MKMIGHSSRTLFEPLIRSGLRLGLTLIITLMVISSPIFMLVNPASAAPSSSTDGSPSAPSTIGQDGSDFTTQAALSSLTARPTNNIVNTNSFYDVVFLTATAGAIKTIQVTFPAGTTIPSGAFFNEAEKCVPGSNCTELTGTASKSGQTVTYTVTNAVNVPAGTKIRLEFANINNPLQVSANYKVIVTTRNAANAIIDGPSQSTVYTMKQIGANVIANNAITTPKIFDGAVTNDKLGPFAVTNDKLGSFSVSNSKLGSFSVTSDKVFPDSFSIPAAQRPGTVVNLPQNSPQFADSSCFSGEQVIGGGHDVEAESANDFRLLDSFISGNTWRVSGNNAGGGAMTLQSLAICALPFP